MAQSALVALAVVFMVFPLAFVLLRFWARSLSRVKYGVDDWLIVPAVVCLNTMTVEGNAIVNLFLLAFDNRHVHIAAPRCDSGKLGHSRYRSGSTAKRSAVSRTQKGMPLTPIEALMGLWRISVT